MTGRFALSAGVADPCTKKDSVDRQANEGFQSIVLKSVLRLSSLSNGNIMHYPFGTSFAIDDLFQGTLKSCYREGVNKRLHDSRLRQRPSSSSSLMEGN